MGQRPPRTRTLSLAPSLNCTKPRPTRPPTIPLPTRPTLCDQLLHGHLVTSHAEHPAHIVASAARRRAAAAAPSSSTDISRSLGFRYTREFLHDSKERKKKQRATSSSCATPVRCCRPLLPLLANSLRPSVGPAACPGPGRRQLRRRCRAGGRAPPLPLPYQPNGIAFGTVQTARNSIPLKVRSELGVWRARCCVSEQCSAEPGNVSACAALPARPSL